MTPIPLNAPLPPQRPTGGTSTADPAADMNLVTAALAQARSGITELDGRLVTLEGDSPTQVGAPTASFTHTASALAGTFDGSESSATAERSIVSYHWNFGEGGGIVTTTGPVVSHNFATGGFHTVTLFVLDDSGAQSGTVARSITVVEPSNVAPTASFTVTVSDLTAAFNGSGSTDPDGSIESYAWVFGDGTTGTGPSRIKTYAAAGQYTAALTVTDNKGATHQTTRAVTVTAPGGGTPGSGGTDLSGVTVVWVEGATPNASHNDFAAKMLARAGTTLDRIPDTTPEATVRAKCAQPNTILAVLDGTSLSNVTANVMPSIMDGECPTVVFRYGFVDDLGWTTAATNNVAGGTNLVIRSDDVGKVTSAGRGAGPHAITTGTLTQNAWAASAVPSEADARLFAHDDARVAAFVYPAESTGGWRAGASFWWSGVDPALLTTAAYDFGYGLLVEAAQVARQASGTVTVAAPVLAAPTQIETSSTGGRIRLTATVADPTHDVLWFSAESYAKNGLHFAVTEGDGTTTTRVRDTAEGSFVAPGPQEYWTKARATDDTLSVESNHRQFTVTSTGGGTTPGTSTTTQTILEPFKNTIGQRVRMADGSQGPLYPPVWWLGQPTSGVQYVPTTDPAMADFLRTDVSFRINQGQYGHQVRVASTNDPVAAVEDRNDPGRGITGVFLPLDLVAAVGNDGHAHVVQPPDADGRTFVVEMIGFRRIDATHASASRVHRIPMDGAGLGPSGGVRNYGGSAVAGLIRAWEVDPSHPNYTGKIEHVLAFAASFRQFKHLAHPTLPSMDGWKYYSSGSTNETGQPGWPVGMYRGSNPAVDGGGNPEGFMMRQMPFPITEEDYQGKSDYYGQIPNGSLFVIPPNVTAASIGVTTPQSLMVFQALQDYGMRLVDTVGADASMPLYVETSAPQDWRRAISGSDFKYADLERMRKVMRMVANDRNIATPNGGPIGVPRRGRPVPGF